VKVIGVSDVGGALYNPKGLPIPALVAWAATHRPLVEAEGDWDVITNEELLVSDCNILVPAALGEVIDEGNAGDIRAAMVVEAANNPVTPEADKLLEDRDIRILPDILVNAGGVTGSYFEWAQNIQQFRWKEDRFNAELEDAMHRAFEATAAFAERRVVSLRKAAFAIGIERVARAARLRGYV
jgi:glutamate dehydrogenase (NAD(P)+)